MNPALGSGNPRHRLASLGSETRLTRMTNPQPTSADLAGSVKKLQRAVYYLIWKRTGFGEQCVHCAHLYPGHEPKCKAAEIEELVR